MAHNVYSGNTVRIVAESAVAGGDVVISGGICGVAPYAIAAGATGVLEVFGVFAMPFAAGGALTVGAAVYWDAAAGKAYLTADDGRVKIGVVAEAAAAGAPEGLVLINAGDADTDTTYSAATTAAAGLVKQAAAVADCTPASSDATSVETQLNALLAALRTAGIVAPNAAE